MPSVIVKRRLRQRLIGILVIAFMLLLSTGINYLQPYQPHGTASVTIEVPPSATAAYVAQLLQEKKIIKSSLAFRLLGKFTGQEKMIKAGQYVLSPSQTPQEILLALSTGKTVDTAVKVTIPEGYTVRQMARLLADQGLTDEQDFLEIAQNGDLETKYFSEPVPAEVEFKWEGFFFPDTYFFSPDTSSKEIAQRMLERMDEIWAKEIQGTTDLPVNLSPREFITMASLVEREAMVDHERPLVAAVFYNRLRQNMLLQSCATVQYLFPEAKPVLSTQDTEIPSPYNTYLHMGLPPGPIAAPGRAAIRSVLQPSDFEALYFVAKPDGSHAFSNTFEEHLANQRKYQSP
ncbi:MAG: endolytic transglycosylase MltG [bacterium]|jgi:UPF0755 protein